MPKLDIKYDKTIIYKVVCNDLLVKDIYVGHTTNFNRRKADHKFNCLNETRPNYKLKLYETIRNNGGWDNWTMVMVEEYPCENRLQASSRERYWYENLNSTLNMINPHTTTKEQKHNYWVNNKEAIMAKRRQNDKIKEYNREYGKIRRARIKSENDKNKYLELNI